jgi:hypothetical protein
MIFLMLQGPILGYLSRSAKTLPAEMDQTYVVEPGPPGASFKLDTPSLIALADLYNGWLEQFGCANGVPVFELEAHVGKVLRRLRNSSFKLHSMCRVCGVQVCIGGGKPKLRVNRYTATKGSRQQRRGGEHTDRLLILRWVRSLENRGIHKTVGMAW